MISRSSEVARSCVLSFHVEALPVLLGPTVIAVFENKPVMLHMAKSFAFEVVIGEHDGVVLVVVPLPVGVRSLLSIVCVKPDTSITCTILSVEPDDGCATIVLVPVQPAVALKK